MLKTKVIQSTVTFSRYGIFLPYWLAWAAVLPTSGMCVLPDQLKKSAADEKIRPHTLEAFCWHLQRFLTQNMTIKFVKWILYLYKLYKILWRIHTKRKFGPFSAMFRQICRIFGRGFSRPLIFLWGHFCVLRPKFRPVGNTGWLTIFMRGLY
jgi:hypothetical protein